MRNRIMDIGEVARTSGLPVSTLRYYESQGLIRSVGRRGLRRLFDASVLERLSFIMLGQRAQFPLDQIATMFAPDSLRVNRAQLARKADQIDQQIKELQAVRDGLRHAAKCPAPSHLECATFQRLLRAVRRKQINKMRFGHQDRVGSANTHAVNRVDKTKARN